MKSKEEVIAEMQLVVEQMRLDDIEENPDSENEYFTCHACGAEKPPLSRITITGIKAKAQAIPA